MKETFRNKRRVCGMKSLVDEMKFTAVARASSLSITSEGMHHSPRGKG
jgi:hypothetical protein